MTYDENQLLPIEQIKNELFSLCVNEKSGDFCLFTEEKHVAVISFYMGDIVGLRYRISRGNNALKHIKCINKAKITFKETSSDAVNTAVEQLPSTEEILNYLGVESSDDGAANNARKKILVVEDSRTQRAVICRMLQQNGYDTVEAADGYDALNKLDNNRLDMILLDIVMPGIDGYKVMSLIKEKPGMKDIPIIMLTSRDNLIDKMRGKISGTNEYLTKPFKYEELIGKIDKYLFTETGTNLLNAHP